MNLVARALGGIISDRCAAAWGVRGRIGWLFVALLGEGLLLMLFSQAGILPLSIVLMLAFGLFVKMSNGATYAVVLFVNRRALGTVAGIVGAGGNAGAVLAGMCFGVPESRINRTPSHRGLSPRSAALRCHRKLPIRIYRPLST
jgi:NNP family nitrate/nitrite transporter-like MFS transporter